MKNVFRVSISLVMLLNWAPTIHADWLQFRGAKGDSFTPTSLPVEFGGDESTNVAWKTDLPGRSVGGPIVVGQQVITTASSGHQQKRLHVIALDSDTGKIQWHRRLWATGRTLCHPLSAVAAATPASDGQFVFVAFSSNDVACFDTDGDVMWLRSLTADWPNAFDDRGLASSPWVAGDTLIVPIACAGDSFLFGLSKTTGETNWKIPLTKDTNWTTPCDIRIDGVAYVLFQSADKLMVIEPKSGDVKLEYEAEGAYIPSPTVVGDRVLLPTEGLSSLQLDGLNEPELVWYEAKIGAESASPVVSEDRCFVIRRPNILTAASLDDGSVHWKKRLDGNGFWATPILTKQHIYVANTDGLVQVVSLEDGEIAAKNDLGEEILGSPAASDEAIYFRSTSGLIKGSL